MNTEQQIELLIELNRELKYELDRLKHEVTILRIESDSYQRRFDIQTKTNTILFEQIKLREPIR